MSFGPEKIILILVVALIVFGPQRLPDIARQVGSAMRELRRMQDTVRGELEHVLHPDFSPASHETASVEAASIEASEDTDHAALPPASASALPPAATGASTAGDFDFRSNAGDYPNDDIADDDLGDDGFAGPRSFS